MDTRLNVTHRSGSWKMEIANECGEREKMKDDTHDSFNRKYKAKVIYVTTGTMEDGAGGEREW